MEKENYSLEKRFKENQEWNPEDCKELVKLAGMEKEWQQAEGEDFERVLQKAADKIGIELF